jgi:glycosyltransferase involved in cell wall biosynthesis
MNDVLNTSTDDNKILLTILIPAYNEERVIGSVINSIKLLNLPQSEIIVIDDGSTDKTAEVSRNSGALVHTHPYNIGNGAAIKTGIRVAKGLGIVILDGDGQHQAKDIRKIVAGLSKYNMVVGARTNSSQTSLIRDIGNWIFNNFASYVAEYEIKDLTSGFRAFRRKDGIRFCDLLPNKFSSPTTLTLTFLRSGRTVKYLPIDTLYRVGKSKIKIFQDGTKFLLIIIKISTLFSPYRVFIPISLAFFISGLVRYIYTFINFNRFTNMSELLFLTSVIVFMLGLIAEQIASLRLEVKEPSLYFENDGDYEVFNQLGINPNLVTKTEYLEELEVEELTQTSTY